jgi:asparagine synthase (glutamine-hydrolysing)
VSGIYGIYRYDGGPIEPEWLERMKQAMAYYGPDGGECRISGPVGMGYLLRTLNPEDIFEDQPMRGERGLVACTARLDNREELLDTFKIPGPEASRTPDGRLVGLAFDRWGEDVCSHLEGDWAFAAWDARERRLFLGRDPFGMSALYYYNGKGFFAFATSIKALLALPGIEKGPDMLRLAEVLIGWHIDPELTAYKGFRSVVGAHSMTVDASGGIHDRRFWSVNDPRETTRFRRREELDEAFLELYTRAVRNCIRTQKPITLELSGGRDSGSVVALAAPILASQGREMTAYTSIPYLAPDGAGKGRIGNEWELAHATATMAGANVKHVAVDARDYSVTGGIEHHLDMHDGPGHAATNQYWVQAIMEACQRQNAGVLLVGTAGNLTTSWGGNGSAVLALRQGNPATALRLFFLGEANPWYVLKRQIVKPMVTPARRLLNLLKTFGSPWQSYSPINPQLVKELDLDRHMLDAGCDLTFTSSPFMDYRELYFKPDKGTSDCIWSDAGSFHSVDCVDPTANLALFEFLLRVPDDEFYRGGETSVLFRRAFRNRLPEAVLEGKRKGLQGADVGHRINRELPAFEEMLRSFEPVPEAREALDLPRLHRCLAEVSQRVDPKTTQSAAWALCLGCGVGLFLRRLAAGRC